MLRVIVADRSVMCVCSSCAGGRTHTSLDIKDFSHRKISITAHVTCTCIIHCKSKSVMLVCLRVSCFSVLMLGLLEKNVGNNPSLTQNITGTLFVSIYCIYMSDVLLNEHNSTTEHDIAFIRQYNRQLCE